jgi:hypothetical protein
MPNVEEADGSTKFDPKVGSKKNSQNGDANASTLTRSSDEKGRLAKIKDHKYVRACWGFMTWTPERCRWNPESPPKFSLGLNLLFGFVSILYACRFPSTFHIYFYMYEPSRRK